MSWLTLETRTAEPIQAGKRRLTPISSLLQVTFPGWQGGLVWNRPTAVLVTEADGKETLLPVRDITRLIQILVLSAGVLGAGLIWLAYRTHK